MRALWMIALVSACGGAQKPVASEETQPPTKIVAREPVESEPDDQLEVEGLKGRLSSEAISRGLSPHQGELDACYTSSVKGSRYLAGKMELQFSVAIDGSVQKVDLANNDLGSWTVEKCLLDVARTVRFDRPDGGEAQVTVPLHFDNARTPAVLWEAERLGMLRLTMIKEKIRPACGAVPKGAQVTLYVGRRGKVQSVGFSNTRKGDDAREWKDCAERIIKEQTLVDPRGSVVKASFWLSEE